MFPSEVHPTSNTVIVLNDMKIAIASSLIVLLLRETNSFSVTSSSSPLFVFRTEKDDTKTNKRQVLQTMAQVVLERSDTLRSAGFYEKQNENYFEPLVAGAKTNIILFCLALGYKWYRSIFINKVRD